MEDGKKINHYCVVCGVGYHACDSCVKEKTFTPWRTLTDTIEHFKIFMVLKDYNNKMIDRDQAKNLLSNVDLSGKENFKDSIKRLLADIYFDSNEEIDNEETPIKKKPRKYKKQYLENETMPE